MPTARSPTSPPISRSTGKGSFSRARSSASTTRSRLLASRSIKTAFGRGRTGRSSDAGFSVQLTGVEGATILIAKQDPGQGIVWLAFLSLLSGLLITFYLPRRRVWTRLSPDGELRICGRADRYVDFEREF